MPIEEDDRICFKILNWDSVKTEIRVLAKGSDQLLTGQMEGFGEKRKLPLGRADPVKVNRCLRRPLSTNRRLIDAKSKHRLSMQPADGVFSSREWTRA